MWAMFYRKATITIDVNMTWKNIIIFQFSTLPQPPTPSAPAYSTLGGLLLKLKMSFSLMHQRIHLSTALQCAMHLHCGDFVIFWYTYRMIIPLPAKSVGSVLKCQCTCSVVNTADTLKHVSVPAVY